jgi:hypothetical protein
MELLIPRLYVIDIRTSLAYWQYYEWKCFSGNRLDRARIFPSRIFPSRIFPSRIFPSRIFVPTRESQPQRQIRARAKGKRALLNDLKTKAEG